MINLKLDNFGSRNIIQQARLAADAVVGSPIVQLESTEGLKANDFTVLGPRGTDLAEPLVILSVDSLTQVTFKTNVTLKHDQGDYIVSLIADQIQVYSAPNVDNSQPPDSAFTTHGAPFNITIYQMYTAYSDTATTDTWYKFAYVNSVTSVSTGITDSEAFRSGTVHYCALDEIRMAAGYMNNLYITDIMIATKRKQAQAHVDGVLQSAYNVPFPAPVNPAIEKITAQFAAAYLQQDDYGIFASGSSKDGEAREKRAEASLQAINTRDEVLVDYNGDNIALPHAGSTQGYPTDDMNDLSDNGNNRLFDMGKVF